MRLTEPANPPVLVMFTVEVALSPWMTVRAAGFISSVKPPAGAAFTVKASVVVCSVSPVAFP